jgi:hypothetical protein
LVRRRNMHAPVNGDPVLYSASNVRVHRCVVNWESVLGENAPPYQLVTHY